MKISSKGRYALRLMTDLAQCAPEKWVSLKEISTRQEISMKYLEQIVTRLCRAKLLVSMRGPQGGYRFAKPVEDYTVGEILRAVEGELAPVPCLEGEPGGCERRDCCESLRFWKGLSRCVNEYVDSVTLAQLLTSC